jgi:predicted adenine nucleotide alpha hydrolase (AANH) superfamily ATPase
MNILLHTCCAPCACYPTEKMTQDGQQFTLLFYNPNIQPYKEFKHRLATLREFVVKKNYQLVLDKSYPLETWVRGALNEPTVRCAYCYRTRLRYAAAYAASNGFDAFSTTLLVSPYQKHDLIRQLAEEAADEFKIPFYYEDFRVGYQRGVDISLELGLYRQPYCGCVFSERDRFRQPPKPLPDGLVPGAARIRINKNILELR